MSVQGGSLRRDDRGIEAVRNDNTGRASGCSRQHRRVIPDARHSHRWPSIDGERSDPSETVCIVVLMHHFANSPQLVLARLSKRMHPCNTRKYRVQAIPYSLHDESLHLPLYRSIDYGSPVKNPVLRQASTIRLINSTSTAVAFLSVSDAFCATAESTSGSSSSLVSVTLPYYLSDQ